jgi:hypothetical protein
VFNQCLLEFIKNLANTFDGSISIIGGQMAPSSKLKHSEPKDVEYLEDLSSVRSEWNNLDPILLQKFHRVFVMATWTI